MPGHRMTFRPAHATALALVALLVASAALEARIWLRTPTPQDYAAAAAVVRKGFAGGDRLALAPAWALRPLEALGDLPAVGITAVNAGLVLGAQRLWVVADPDGTAQLEALGRRYPLGQREQTGALTVARLDVANTLPWHAVAALPLAQVTLVKPGGEVACNVPHPVTVGWSCPGEPDWQRTTAEWLDVGGVHSGGDLALWAHPPGAGERKRIHFSQVPLNAFLVVGGAHTEYGARSARAPVRVQLDINGTTVLLREFAPHHGWTVERVALPEDLQHTQADVTVWIDSAQNASNHFALDLGVAP